MSMELPLLLSSVEKQLQQFTNNYLILKIMANLKSFSLALAATALSLSASAGVYEAYSEDFATVTDPTTVGFKSSAAAGNLTVKEGVFVFTTPSAGRSGYVYWGKEVWEAANAKNNGTDNFFVSFDFALANSTDTRVNQRNTEIAIISTADPADAVFTKNARFTEQPVGAWAGGHEDYLFDICEDFNNAGADYYMVNRPDQSYVDGVISQLPETKYAANDEGTQLIDTVAGVPHVMGPRYNFPDGVMFHLEMRLDSVNRTATTVITNIEDGSEVLNTVRSIPATVSSQLPTGIFMLNSKQGGSIKLDNIVVGKYVEGEVATAPTATLVEISGAGVWDGLLRKYAFFCKEGETVHYKVAAGTAVFIGEDEADEEGTFEYADIALESNFLTIGTSTTLELWTTIGDVESDHVTVDVVCEKLQLQSPTVSIVGVDAGYKKEYQFSVNTDNIPVAVEVSVSWKYGDLSGVVPNGGKVTVEGQGVLEFVSKASSYTDSETAYEANNVAYEVVDKFDFVNMTDAQKEAAGFTKGFSTGCSGRITSADKGVAFDNTGNFVGKKEDGTIVPLSFVEGNDDVFGVKSSEFAEGKGFFAGQVDGQGISFVTQTCNWFVYKYAGLGSAGHKGDDDAGNWEKTVSLGFNYPENYFAVVEWTSNYGNKVAPKDTVYNFDESMLEAEIAKRVEAGIHYNSQFTDVIKIAGFNEEAKPITTLDKTRLSDLIHVITILAPEGASVPSALQQEKKVVEDGIIYNVAGQKMNPANLKKGLYIKNGKAFLVK